MNLIQPILIAFLAVAAVLAVWSLRFRLVMRIVCIVLAAVGILFVLHPEFTSAIAKALGVGRGTDLVLYVFIVACIYALMIMYVRQRELRRDITELTRQFALQNATKLGTAEGGQRT